MHGQVGRELRGGHHGRVGHYLIMGAVVQDADDGAIPHRVAGQVPHALAGALAVEPAALQPGQGLADGKRPGEGAASAENLLGFAPGGD